MSGSLPLAAQLSAALVAFTVEADNAAERRVTHCTTAHGQAGRSDAVWMTSIAIWFNCLGPLSEAGPLTVSELEQRARMPTNLDGVRRWGYVTIDGVGRVRRGAPRPSARRASRLALTAAGAEAAGVWAPVPAEIEGRWRERFGAGAVARLRAALEPLVGAFPAGLPDFLPIGSARGVGIDEPPAAEVPADVTLPLVSLLSRVLLAFALEYERGARLSLAVQLNGLRVIDREGVAVRELPSLSGVSKAAIAMILTRLAEVRCVAVEPIPGAKRGKQAQLVGKPGTEAKATGGRRVDGVLAEWRRRHGASVIDELGAALAPIVGDGTRTGSRLFEGLEPPPGTWRADTAAPERLPWFPMVLHRGGYPDGS